MVGFSADFVSALQHTLILTATALAMSLIWSYLRVPEGNLLIIVFAFLSAVRISDFSSLKTRLKIISRMAVAAVLLQFAVSSTCNVQILNILLPAVGCRIILQKMTSASAYPVLLTGFLSYSAQPGVYAAAQRTIDILIAGTAALLITLSFPGKKSDSDSTGEHFSKQEVLIQSFTIFCAILLYKILSMSQGIWIILTIIFIYIARHPGISTGRLAYQRIFSVPAGILLGGIYSGTAAMFDSRLVYLAPLIGAAGFFKLFYRQDFFSFTLLFMAAFTICADWMTGTYRDFNFLQFLFGRTLATVIGTAVLLIVEKSASYSGAATT